MTNLFSKDSEIRSSYDYNYTHYNIDATYVRTTTLDIGIYNYVPITLDIGS